MNRKLVRISLAAAVSALAVAGVVANAGVITGSKHDLSGNAWTNGQICIVCHTPHNANPAVPLWNHAQSTATYTLYTNPATLNATTAQPTGVSKLCLSCHDGTVAVNSFGGTTGAVTIAASANFGTDLSNDHPIAFTYNTALATTDGALWDPAVKTATIGSGTKTKTGTLNATLLYNGSLECSSCHDVHNTFTLPAGTTAGTSGTGATSNKLVKVSMFGSALCLTCHDK